MPVASLLEAAMRCPLTRSAGNALSVVSWVMGTANRVKGRAVVILSVDATHLLMASEISGVVGMKAVPQTPGYVWLHHPCLLGVPVVRRVQYGGWKMGKHG